MRRYDETRHVYQITVGSSGEETRGHLVDSVLAMPAMFVYPGGKQFKALDR